MTATAQPGLRVVAAALQTYQKVFTGPAAPLLSRPRPVRRTGFDRELIVDSITPEADGVVGLTLHAADGQILPAWTPGAHLDLLLPSGRQRQYSLCGDPADRSRYRIAVRLIADGYGGSREIHHRVREGQTLTTRGPRNAFPLASSPHYLFLAAGIGITPILPMTHAAETAGASWRLVYFGRSRATMPFLDQLAPDNLHVRPNDEHGPPDIAAALRLAPRGASIYVCGPPPFTDTVRELLTEINPSAGLHSERFSPPPVVGGKPCTVTLARAGTTVQVGARESLLTAIQRVRPDVPYSCQQGFCGSCRTRVLAGTVDGTPAGHMLICVDRGQELLLDL